MGEPEGKKPLVRPRCRRENNIKKYLHEVGYESMAWIELPQYRDRWRALKSATMNFRVA
jgi:hypothetical protein